MESSMNRLLERLSDRSFLRQLAIDVGLLLGFLTVRFLLSRLFPQGGSLAPLPFILITCAVLVMIGGFAGQILHRYQESLDMQNPAGKVLGWLFLGIFGIYGFLIVIGYPILLFSPIADSLGGFLGPQGEMSYFTLFAMAAPFAFLGLGFLLNGGLNTPSIPPFIRLVRFLTGLLYLALIPLWAGDAVRLLPPPRQGTILVVLILAGGILIVGVLPMLLKRLLLWSQAHPEALNRIRKRKWLPFLGGVGLALALYLWNDSILHTLAGNILADRQILTSGDFILLLLIGPVPLRLLAALQPSRHWVMKSVSVLLLGFLVWQLYQQFMGLMPG